MYELALLSRLRPCHSAGVARRMRQPSLRKWLFAVASPDADFHLREPQFEKLYLRIPEDGKLQNTAGPCCGDDAPHPRMCTRLPHRSWSWLQDHCSRCITARGSQGVYSDGQ